MDMEQPIRVATLLLKLFMTSAPNCYSFVFSDLRFVVCENVIAVSERFGVLVGRRVGAVTVPEHALEIRMNLA